MRVHLSRTTRFPQAELQRVYELLSRDPGPIEFYLKDRPMFFEKNDFDWDDFFLEMHVFRDSINLPDDECLVCVTELTNNRNWFSAFDPNGSNSIFVHGVDWEHFVYSEPKYPIAFEVILNVLQRRLFPDFQKVEGHPLIHILPRGCINDMCIIKTEIGFKMRTADLCLDCSQAYHDLFGDTKILEQTVEILERLRRGMVQSRVYLKPLSFEEKLPFSVAITKRKMGMTSQTFRRFLMMIDHFDSLVRTAVIMLAHLYLPDRSAIDNFFASHELNQRPSLGNWVQALAALAKTGDKPNQISLPPNFANKLKQVVALESERKIVSIRNEMRGHGYIECDDEGYEKENAELLPVLEEIERALAPLFERFHYFYVRKTNHKDEGEIIINHVSLVGSNPAFLETESSVVFNLAKDVPKFDKCYLVTSDKKHWTCMDPYIKFGVCPECKHPRLLIFDGDVYLDPFVGHRVELS
jgi:hypothetical protein